MSEGEFVVVGKIGRTRGVHGEIYIIPKTDFPDRFLGLSEIHIENRTGWEKIKLESSSLISGKPVVRFENVTTPEDAARFTNRRVAVIKSEMVALPEGSHYIYDLIGCSVIEENTDKLLGTIENVETYPANDVYVINMLDGKVILFPAIKQFVKSIDISKRRIIIDPTGIPEDEET